MDLSIGRDLAITRQRAEGNVDEQSQFQASNYIVAGRFLVSGIGEVTKDISFPVTFLDEPSFFSGAVLEDNQTVEIGFLPTVNCIVLSWIKQGNLCKGTRLAVVIEGRPDTLKVWINYQFMGHALVNPVGDSELIEGTI